VQTGDAAGVDGALADQRHLRKYGKIAELSGGLRGGLEAAQKRQRQEQCKKQEFYLHAAKSSLSKKIPKAMFCHGLCELVSLFPLETRKSGIGVLHWFFSDVSWLLWLFWLQPV